jgi:hypothetical protein
MLNFIMPSVYAQDYVQAARERMTQASLLRRSEHYALAMYVAGVAAESMLRAYHLSDEEFDEKHDISQLYKRCDFGKLGDEATKRLRGPVETVHLLWQNRFRFFCEDRLRAHIKALGQHQRGVYRGADFLKVRCKDLEDACVSVVTIGVERWQQIRS